MDNFGDWIRAELQKRNWKQADLARQALQNLGGVGGTS